MIRRVIPGLAAGLLALLAALPVAAVVAQTPDPQAPVVVYRNIKNGDTITEPAFVLHLCFDRPVNVKDLDVGGAFLFEVNQPDGIGLGHRDVFQPDGYGVAIYPGNTVGNNLAGEWTFKYRVTSPDAQHSVVETIKFTVDPAGQPIPRETPLSCISSGGTETATPVRSGPVPTVTVIFSSPLTPSAGTMTVTPSPSLQPRSTGPGVTAGPVVEEGGGAGPDILPLALITVGVGGAAAVLVLIGYFVRRRVGYEPHKPKPGDEDGRHH